MSREEAYKVLKLEPDANFYDILGVKRNASREEINKQYRKLTLKYHPDKYKESDEVFKLISEAVKTLGDNEEREVYNFTLNDKTKAQEPKVSSIDLEAIIKAARKFFSREEVEVSFADNQPVEQRITIDDLDRAIEEKKDTIVIEEISARTMDLINEPNDKTDKDKEQIEDMLAYAPQYRSQIAEVLVQKVSGLINENIKQGSGYITDDSISWKKVENLLNSVPEEYRVQIVSNSLEGIDNTSRRDRLLDLLPKHERELAMMDVKPTAWQAIREAAALMRGDAGFEYDSPPVIVRAADKGKGR